MTHPLPSRRTANRIRKHLHLARVLLTDLAPLEHWAANHDPTIGGYAGNSITPTHTTTTSDPVSTTAITRADTGATDPTHTLQQSIDHLHQAVQHLATARNHLGTYTGPVNRTTTPTTCARCNQPGPRLRTGLCDRCRQRYNRWLNRGNRTTDPAADRHRWLTQPNPGTGTDNDEGTES